MQLNHATKNYLNYVVTTLDSFGDRFTAPSDEEDFDSMLHALKLCLSASTHLNVLKQIHSGEYVTRLEAVRVGKWQATYAKHRSLQAHPARDEPSLPQAIAKFDLQIAELALEDGRSNAWKYGDTAQYRPKMSVAAVGRDRLAIAIVNRQLPGARLPAGSDGCPHLFVRGAIGAQGTGLSEGHGLADAKKGAAAARATVGLYEHADDDDVWYTTFRLTMPCVWAHPGEYSEGSAATTVGRLLPRAPSTEEVLVPAALGAIPTFTPTVVAVDDSLLQRKILTRVYLPRLDAAPSSLVLGESAAEIRSVCATCLALPAHMVLLDQDLAHDGLLGTDIARELRAAGFAGLICLRTGAEDVDRYLRENDALDVVICKGGSNLDGIEEVKTAFENLGGGGVPRASPGARRRALR